MATSIPFNSQTNESIYNTYCSFFIILNISCSSHYKQDSNDIVKDRLTTQVKEPATKSLLGTSLNGSTPTPSFNLYEYYLLPMAMTLIGRIEVDSNDNSTRFRPLSKEEIKNHLSYFDTIRKDTSFSL